MNWNKSRMNPSDLDKIFNAFLYNIKNFFSGSKYDYNKKQYGVRYILLMLFVFLSVVYLIIGFYIVKPAEQAVVTRLGKYNRVNYQGPHWIPVFFEKKK